MNAAKKHLESKIASAVIDVVGNPAVPAEAAAAAPIIDAVTKKLAPEIVNATNSEPIWQSRVTIGAVAGLIGGTYGLVLDFLDGTLPTAESLTAQVRRYRWRRTHALWAMGGKEAARRVTLKGRSVTSGRPFHFIDARGAND